MLSLFLNYNDRKDTDKIEFDNKHIIPNGVSTTCKQFDVHALEYVWPMNLLCNFLPIFEK